jgi:hypothetical protein
LLVSLTSFEFPWVIEYYIFDLNQIINSFMLR